MTRPIIISNFENQPSIELYKIKIDNELSNSNLLDKKGFFLDLHNIKISDSKLKFLTDSVFSSL